MPTTSTRTAIVRSIVIGLALAAAFSAAGCDPPPAPGGAPTTATSVTGQPAGTATGSSAPGLVAPSNVRLSGRLPDLRATVPPGEGESGRLTVSWEAPPGAQGFRIYLRDCDGIVRSVLELGAAERSYGPFQPCRPSGNVGVSAFDARGESAITWVR